MSGYAEYRQLWVELGLLKPEPLVPDWARYVCLDPNGDAWAYMLPPIYDPDAPFNAGGAWMTVGTHRLIWRRQDGPYPHALAALLCVPIPAMCVHCGRAEWMHTDRVCDFGAGTSWARDANV